MTSIELGEAEEIAKIYSNGNISRYIRELIIEDHQRKTQLKQQNLTDTKIELFQLFCFFFLGVTLFVFAINTSAPMPNIILISLFITSGFLIMLFAYIKYKNNIKKEMVGEKKSWI